MTKAIQITETGGPECLTLIDSNVGEPGPGQVRLRQKAAGVNYIDTYHRTGLYPVPLPSGLGLEGAGVVEAIGPDVSSVQVGDRVAYSGGPLGGYAEVRLYPAEKLVKLPDDISDEAAAGMMLRGLTVQYLIRRTFKVEPGMTVLFHAAAGGVGLIACQWLASIGATVIGTVGSDEKAALAKEHGCAHVINYSTESFKDRVLEITDGKGVPVVYDGVGARTFMDSLDCLQRLGMMVTFGNASGPVPEITPALLGQKGGLFLTRPSTAHYFVTREELKAGSADLFAAVTSGAVKIRIGASYPLAEAKQAHIDLEDRKSLGSTILTIG